MDSLHKAILLKTLPFNFVLDFVITKINEYQRASEMNNQKMKLFCTDYANLLARSKKPIKNKADIPEKKLSKVKKVKLPRA